MTGRRLVLLALMLASGLFFVKYFWYFGLFLMPPETFGDMNSQIESIEPPDNARLVTTSQSGLRSGFAGANSPAVGRQYAIPWEPDAVCDQIHSLAQSYEGEVVSDSASVCEVSFTVSPGLKARLLGVSEYGASMRLLKPEAIQRKTITDEECEKNEAAAAASENPLAVRMYKCAVESGEGLVWVSLWGEQGW